jgi:hypothetical protein
LNELTVRKVYMEGGIQKWQKNEKRFKN